MGRKRRQLERLTYPLGIQRRRHRHANEGNRDAVFIWIPKAAGTSVQALLARHGCPKLKEEYEARYGFAQRGLVTFGHQSYLALLEAGIVSRDFDRRAWKFCFVRNPFERAVSLFAYLKQTRSLHANLGFQTFAHLLADRAYEDIGLYNVRGLSQCNPQIAWVRDGQGRLFVDFVGRVESIERDLETVCRELGIEGSPLRVNVSEHAPYRDYYDDESRRLVAKAYEEDLDSFGYAF